MEKKHNKNGKMKDIGGGEENGGEGARRKHA